MIVNYYEWKGRLTGRKWQTYRCVRVLLSAMRGWNDIQGRATCRWGQEDCKVREGRLSREGSETKIGDKADR